MSKKENLLNKISDRPIVIWGARMTGIGFSRFLKLNNQPKEIAFVDSDKALENKNINGTTIYNPKELINIKNNNPSLLIVIAVSLKEIDIIKNLESLGLLDQEYIIYSEYSTDFYTVDVVGTCNLKCPSCAHGSSGMESPLGFMSFDNFEKVIEKATNESDIVSHISLYSWGEPLLHNDLARMIDYLHDRGIAVAISSNFSIKSTEQIEKVIKSAPDYLKISISGFYPEAYNDTHTGGDIRLVKSNLYRIRYLIDKLKVSTLVDVNYHLYNNNCGNNLKKMKELCNELDFSLSTVYSLVMPLERVIQHCDGYTTDEVKLLNSKLLVEIDEGMKASKPDNKDNINCPFRENQVNVNWDLSVPVCCTVYNRNPDTIVAQNYLNTSLKDINKNKKDVNICSKCIRLGLPEYNMGFNRKNWEKIAKSKECKDLS